MSNPSYWGVFSCDTLVSIGHDGDGRRRTVFGKNSDRAWNEAQPLQAVVAASHPKGAAVRCQYLTIPQVSQTLSVLGSRPWWLWGFEHGVNEAGVAIGNEAIYTRDEVPGLGLLGMDLVRLGLERGRTALQAKSVVTDLLEQYGQGGSSLYLSDVRYNNSFIIADSADAYILETSGRHWVSKRLSSSAAIANLVTIEDDWDESSSGIDDYARARNWWWGPRRRKLNFRAAFEDREMRVNTEDRYNVSRRYLESSVSTTVPEMMRHLRDHFESGTVNIEDAPDKPYRRSICCHPGRFASATAASLVVELVEGQVEPLVAWCSMGTPCTGVFLPLPVGTELPLALTLGGEHPDPNSVWWAMRELGGMVEGYAGDLSPLVQQVWSEWESGLLASTAGDVSSVRDLQSLVDTLRVRRSALAEAIEERLQAIEPAEDATITSAMQTGDSECDGSTFADSEMSTRSP